jgi:RNA polymerase sigma-70 factor (ECF subfamily)
VDDGILIQQIAQGDSQAFGQLVDRYQQRLVRFAARLLGDPDAAQDIAQETFLRLWRSRARCPVESDLNAYLLRIARNLCLDRFRAQRKTEVLDETTGLTTETECGPAASAQSRALAELVRHAVQALPEPQRVVFILSHYEALSYHEIAQVVGCPIGTVASRKYQAVETLRRRLKPWIDGDAM